MVFAAFFLEPLPEAFGSFAGDLQRCDQRLREIWDVQAEECRMAASTAFDQGRNPQRLEWDATVRALLVLPLCAFNVFWKPENPNRKFRKVKTKSNASLLSEKQNRNPSLRRTWSVWASRRTPSSSARRSPRCKRRGSSRRRGSVESEIFEDKTFLRKKTAIMIVFFVVFSRMTFFLFFRSQRLCNF